jgi:ribonuclease P protein component
MAFFNIMENPSEKPTRLIRYKFKKEERLSSKKMIDKLFAEGTSFLVYPIKVVYLDIDLQGEYQTRAAFAVSKKLFKKAVSRNLIKRRMKEAYRLNKHMLPLGSENPRRAIMFIYIGKEILQYPSVVKAMVRILQILKKNSTRRP